MAVSVDGATVGFAPDQGLFYQLARNWAEDVTLVGADTILAQEPALAGASRPGPAADGPLLAVVDSRARVREWAALRAVGHWSDVLALRAADTPPRPAAGVRELVAGTGRVDLAVALRALAADHGAAVVRVDSGGALIGALLAAGLVDELSLLVHPVLVGAGVPRWFGSAGRRPEQLQLVHAEPFRTGAVWVHYRR